MYMVCLSHVGRQPEQGTPVRGGKNLFPLFGTCQVLIKNKNKFLNIIYSKLIYSSN